MSISLARPFMFATGIENSCPTVALPDGTITRVDEMEKCGHYGRWREDFALVRELGIDYLRYGPPYHRTHVGPGRYDWSFADETFNALRELGITPIVDLCHFGVPDWIGNFQNPEWPSWFEEYARAFAERYPWCHIYTPINEMFVCAAQFGNEKRFLALDLTYGLCAPRRALVVVRGGLWILRHRQAIFRPISPTDDAH